MPEFQLLAYLYTGVTYCSGMPELPLLADLYTGVTYCSGMPEFPLLAVVTLHARAVVIVVSELSGL